MNEPNPLRWLEDIASELNLIRKALEKNNELYREDIDKIEKVERKLEAMENE